MRRTRLAYGPRRGQFGELSLPDRVRLPPVVVLLHGGTWRGIYSFRLVRPLARALAGRGSAVWNVEYRRMGFAGSGGGWPATFDDVAAAVDYVGRLEGVDADRVATCGHSAGGHLALWAAARQRLPAGAPGANPVQQVRAAVGLAPVSDLERLPDFGLGTRAVEGLLGGTIESVPERWRAASPAALLPLGLPQLLVHGLDDTTVPPAMSEAYVRRARSLGDDASYLALPGVNHRQVLERHRLGVASAAELFDRALA